MICTHGEKRRQLYVLSMIWWDMYIYIHKHFLITHTHTHTHTHARIYIYIYIYACVCVCVIRKCFVSLLKMAKWSDVLCCGWWFGWFVLRHINLCRLFNAKSGLFVHIGSMNCRHKSTKLNGLKNYYISLTIQLKIRNLFRHNWMNK